MTLGIESTSFLEANNLERASVTFELSEGILILTKKQLS